MRILYEVKDNLKFYIEFNPCKECKDIIKELNENTTVQTDEGSKKFLRHITYNHTEVVQAIIAEFPKESDKENFPWFR
ncbi:MAG TPA: hypothetical protein VFP45_04790 [Candidatus Nitrosotalea sp.]|nr:hypothetical protein [Candidatus Nitrosotalea sp.]